MSLAVFHFTGTVYRAHNPRWSFAPDSGAGAAKHSGRFNPAGTPALYTSSSYTLAIAEAQQGLPYKLQPLTIVSYDVDHDSVLDLSSSDGRFAADTTLETLGCAWELIAHEGRTPPSWALAKRLIACGFGGIVVPSFAPGAGDRSVNYVFWDWSPKKPRQVAVNDDGDRLPKNQSSWSDS